MAKVYDTVAALAIIPSMSKSCNTFIAIRSGALCQRAEDWEWSSFRQYANGCQGRVEIESERTARKCKRAAGRLFPRRNSPTQAKRWPECATRPH
jgi:hypothetical protein